jgi:hypothetical protein
MSRKYVRQRISENFVYPNNTVSEYDIEIVHDINDNSVSGTVTNFVCDVTTTQVTVTFDWTFSLNGAERFIDDNNLVHLFSVHMMEPSTTYFKPWRLIGNRSTSNLTGTTFSSSSSYTVNASDFQISGFTAGDYVFEVRFIGHRAIFPVCVTSSEVPLTPTPTPTPTLTRTPFPTPTPTSGCTCATPTITCAEPGEGANEVDVYFTTTNCPDCSVSTIEISYDQITWTGNTAGCTSPRTIDGSAFTEPYYMRIKLQGSCGESSYSPTYTYTGLACTTPTPTPTITATATATPTLTPSTGVQVTSVFGYMEPCIGGTIDDYMGAYVSVNSPVTSDTSFDVTVYYEVPPTNCSGPFSGASYTRFFVIDILSGQTTSNFNACSNGFYLASGANICGACITSCSDPSIILGSASC